jgi:hypothetical protein
MRFEFPIRGSACSVLAGLLLLAACDEGPASPGPRPDTGFLVTVYECTTHVQSGTTSCQLQPVGSGLSGPRFDIIVGQPYMSLTASGSVVSNGNSANPDTTTLTWTLTNELPQPVGTSDGFTPHPNGTRAFFLSGPSAAAAKPGTTVALKTLGVTANNALGPATFTSAQGQSWTNRRFYQFDGALAQGDSATTLVRFVYDSRVTAITYQLLVATPVQYEHGWITIAPATAPVLAPGETTTLTGTVYNHLGEIQFDALAWSSSDTTVATVDASGVVTAVGQGTATITATSTVNAQRTGTRTVTVDAVPAVASTTPANGATNIRRHHHLQRGGRRVGEQLLAGVHHRPQDVHRQRLRDQHHPAEPHQLPADVRHVHGDGAGCRGERRGRERRPRSARGELRVQLSDRERDRVLTRQCPRTTKPPPRSTGAAAFAFVHGL